MIHWNPLSRFKITDKAAVTGLHWILLCGVIFPAVTPAAETMPTEEDFLGDIPIVLSATRLAQPRSEAPAAITVIDREMIEASGATNIPELFRLVPGFQVGHEMEDLFVTNPVSVTYHGLSDAYARRMQVLIDGRSVYSPDFGGVRWSNLSIVLEDIERIEIIRGPNAATYGANSFLAVINIVTRHPADTHGTFSRVTLSDNNFSDTILRHGGGTNNFDYRLTLGYRQSNGFDNQNDDFQRTLVNFRGEYRLDSQDTLEFQLGHSGGPEGAGAAIPDDPFRTSHQNQSYQLLRWTRDIGNNEETKLSFYHNYLDYDDTYIASILSPNDSTVITDVLTERYDLEFQHILSPFKDWRFVWGAEVRLDQVTAAGWFSGLGTVENHLYRLFTNAEWRITPKWIANGGAMLEHNDFTATGVSPRLAINYLATAHSSWRAIVSKGLRTPAMLEERANSIIDINFVGPVLFYTSSGNLQPEMITSYELGYLGEYRNRNLIVDVKVFQDNIENIISYPGPFGGGPPNIFVNGGSALIRGAEMELQYRPTKRARLFFSYAYTDQTGVFHEVYGPDFFTPTDITTPQHTSGLLGIYELPDNWSASLGYYHVSTMRFFGGDETGGYNKLDLRLAQKLRTDSYKGSIEFIVQNAAGSYFDFNKSVEFDRRYFVRLSLQNL